MQLLEEGKVIHAGTMNSSNPTIAASLATIQVLEAEKPFERLFHYGEKLKKGLQKAALETGQNLLVQGIGPIVHSGFTHLEKVNEYRDTFSFDKVKLGRFISGLHDRGIRVIGRGLWYISTAHTEKEIDQALAAAKEVLGQMTE
jgi:glutamate-1-semialdehyde 2,1-aminomutase